MNEGVRKIWDNMRFGFLIENDKAIDEAMNAAGNAGCFNTKRPRGHRVERSSITVMGENGEAIGKIVWQYRGNKLLWIETKEIPHGLER